MIRKKSLLVLFIIFGFSTLLLSQFNNPVSKRNAPTAGKEAAGAGNGKGADTKGADVTLNVAVSMSNAEFMLLQSQSAHYTETHAGITVQLTNIPQPEAYATLIKANQLGNAADVMLLDNEWVKEFAAQGFLRPLDEFYTGEQQPGGFKAVMDEVQWNGYLWAVPKDVDPYVFVWNTKTAAENKWTHPPETMEEWLNWNQTLMNPDQDRYGIYIDPADPYALISLIAALGDNLIDSASAAMKADDPEFVRQLTSFFTPWEMSDAPTPTPKKNARKETPAKATPSPTPADAWNSSILQKNYPAPSQTWDPWELLLSGKMVAMVTTVSEFIKHNYNQNNPVELADTKSWDGGWIKGRSFSISSHSPNSASAIDWIKAMTSMEAMTADWNQASFLPALPTAYNNSWLLSNPDYISYNLLLGNARTWSIEPNTHQKIIALQAEIQQLWNGKENLQQFLKNSAKLWPPVPTQTG